MEIREDTKKEVMAKMVDQINLIMGFIDLYEPNRPGSIAITKLEEAVMWSQVMVNNASLRADVIEKIEQDRIEKAEKPETENQVA
jgi:hypothetical protein